MRQWLKRIRRMIFSRLNPEKYFCYVYGYQLFGSRETRNRASRRLRLQVYACQLSVDGVSPWIHRRRMDFWALAAELKSLSTSSTTLVLFPRVAATIAHREYGALKSYLTCPGPGRHYFCRQSRSAIQTLRLVDGVDSLQGRLTWATNLVCTLNRARPPRGQNSTRVRNMPAQPNDPGTSASLGGSWIPHP